MVVLSPIQVVSGPGSARFGYGFGGGAVRAAPVFGSGGSSREGVILCFSTNSILGQRPKIDFLP